MIEWETVYTVEYTYKTGNKRTEALTFDTIEEARSMAKQALTWAHVKNVVLAEVTAVTEYHKVILPINDSSRRWAGHTVEPV